MKVAPALAEDGTAVLPLGMRDWLTRGDSAGLPERGAGEILTTSTDTSPAGSPHPASVSVLKAFVRTTDRLCI